ncbi:Uncharacterized protein pbN1_35900 [Aromatoleum bremense]|nr:Uncharacterized protein pbN1_35900 [Aromatoleum bremense]
MKLQIFRVEPPPGTVAICKIRKHSRTSPRSFGNLISVPKTATGRLPRSGGPFWYDAGRVDFARLGRQTSPR